MAKPDQGFIKRLKDLVGGNVTGFARDLGIPQPSLHGYLSGRYTPGFDFFVKLARRGVDLSWLLTGTRADKKRKEDVNLTAQQIAVVISDLRTEDAKVVTKTLRALVAALAEK